MKALVLCGGLGKRLGALTRETPKPMLQIADRPLLAYTLEYLVANGFDQIAINLHFRPEVITGYVSDGSQFGAHVHYSYEDTLLGTAGAVKRLEDYFGTDRLFLVVHGDLLIDQDLAAMVEGHQSHGAIATLLLHQRAGSNSLIDMDGNGRITDLLERPSEKERKERPYPWVNSGLYLFGPRIFSYIPPGEPVDFPKGVFQRIFGLEPLFGFPLTGYRCAIDSADRYKEAALAVQSGSYAVPKTSLRGGN